jgi:hypothetical protein
VIGTFLNDACRDTREGSYHIFIFPARRARALKIRRINSAILKVPDAAWIR